MQRLTAHAKRELRSQLHTLHPVVIIGHDGVTPGVLQEIDRALDAHELIKIRVNGVDRDTLDEIAEKICHSTKSELIQIIGFIVAIYREREEETA